MTLVQKYATYQTHELDACMRIHLADAVRWRIKGRPVLSRTSANLADECARVIAARKA